VDAGVEEGDTVPVYYDPLISKLTAWGRTRAEAIARMDRALSEYDVAGVETTIPFCRFVMQHEAFRSGDFNTGFVRDHFTPDALAPDAETERTAAVAVGLLTLEAPPASPLINGAETEASRWALRRRYR
jgi:propionyl-CoA carboxylase alpha chain